jgi:carbon storage regulator CsrA
MLVLTRKANQQIQIGENIVITVLQIKGNSVRLGIEAPRDVRVVRGELGPKEPVAPVMTEVVVEADVFDAAEMIMPQEAGVEAVASASVKSQAASTSPRQAPTETKVLRDVRCSPLLRFIAAGAATDAPSEWPTRGTERSTSTRNRTAIA